MSYDLVVFEPGAAPADRNGFLAWYTEAAQLGDGKLACNPAATAPILQDWFKRKESEKNKPQEVKDANVARFIAKLEAMTGHDRNKFVATVSANDVVFADCKQRYDLKLQAAKLKADGKATGTSVKSAWKLA